MIIHKKIKYIFIINNITHIGIEELNLSARSYNCLKRANIHYIVDLLEYSNDSLLEIKSLGKKSAEEVIEVLFQRFGLQLSKCDAYYFLYSYKKRFSI